MLIHRLQVLAESDQWIIVTNRCVTKQMLFDLYCYGKVVAITFPLKMKGGLKGVVFISFGKENCKHEDIPLPLCLDPEGRGYSKIKDLHFPSVNRFAAGCRFDIKAVNFLSKGGNYYFVAHQTTFSGSSFSFGALLFERFDLRRLLRVWFQDLLEYTDSEINEGAGKEDSNKMEDVLVSLKEDTEHCMGFMSLDPLEVLGKCQMGKYEGVIQEAFGQNS